MEPQKQIKAVAQTYLQEQQIKQQADYIVMLENAIANIAESMDMSVEDLLNEMAKFEVNIPFTKRKLVVRTGADTDEAEAHLDRLHRRLWRDYNVGGDRNHKVFDPKHNDPEIRGILAKEKKRIEREGI